MEKTYTLPDGTKFIFEYDHNRMGIITLECVDTLMSLLKATAEQTEPQTHDIRTDTHECVKDTHDKTEPSGCWLKDNTNSTECNSCIKQTDCSWR